MKCVRFACVTGALGFLLACSGKYNVGQEPASNAGSPAANAGATTSTAGGVGDDSAGGAPAGGAPAGGAPAGIGGYDPSSTGGTYSGIGGTVSFDYCGQTYLRDTPSVTFASTALLWNRIQLFLMGDAKAVPIPVGLPVTPTRDLAGALADQTLASLNGAPAPGLARFVAAWWPGTPNADAWATVFGDPKLTLTDLLTTNSVANPGSGVLTDPAVLKQGEITARGVFVDEHLRCLQVPRDPANIPAPPPAKPGQTRRELLEQSVTGPLCTGCHMMADPIGFALENYDAVGMFSKLDNGSPIDTSGTLPLNGPVDGDITFSNVSGLGAGLARQCGVSACLTQQLLADAETSAKLPAVDSGDSMAVGRIASAASSGLLRDLIHAIVESDTFMRAK